MIDLFFNILRRFCVAVLIVAFVPLALDPCPVEALVKTKKTTAKKTFRKKTRKTKRSYRKNRSGVITQRYSLEEGLDETGAETISNELLDLGAENASVDINKNLVDVKFKTSRLSSITILSKLKELGYSVKRID